MDENLRTAAASVDRARAEMERARSDFQRAEKLFADKLIPRQEFEAKKSQYEALAAGLREAEARLAQMKAQREQTAAQLAAAQRRVAQVRATMERFADVLQKHSAISPIERDSP